MPQTSDPFASIAQPVAQSSASSSSDPFASIAKPAASSSVPPSTLGGMAEDVGAGFVKGAGDTVSGVSHLLNKIPGIGETLAPSEGISAMDQMDKATNTAQDVGKVGESIAEIAGVDELTGLAKGAKLVELAQKYPLIARTLTLATEHPWLAKIISEGTKGAITGAVQGGLKAAPKGQSETSGAIHGAELGGATGAVIGGLSAAPWKNLRVNPFRAAATKLTGSDIQPTLKTGIQDVWNGVADSAGVPKPTTASVRDMGHEVGDAILARSKANYAAIDAATGQRFSGTEQALKAVNQDLRSVTNDVEEQALMVRKTRLEMQMDQMMDEAETAGVPKATVAAAKSDFKQAQAIYDTGHQIRMSTSGVRPGMQGAKEVPEEVDPKKLMTRMNQLYNKGRLQQAVGEDGAEDLIGHSATAQKAAKNVARNRKAAAIAIPAAAGTVGTAYELTK